MGKKKLKDTKFGKILGGVVKGALDVIPGSSTVGKIISNLDRNKDGKITLADFKPAELAGLFGGLAVLAVLASKGIIDIEILKQIAQIFGL